MDTVDLYRQALESLDIKLKGKNNLYTSHNGHMFTFITKEGTIAVRLSEADKKVYTEKYGTSDVIQYNAVMRGYVEATVELTKNKKKLQSLISRGLAFVSSLPPK